MRGRRGWAALPLALLISSACAPLGRPGDLTPLTGQTAALEPSSIRPAWRTELTHLGITQLQLPAQLSGVGHDAQRDLVVIASSEGTVHCLEASSGQVKWRVPGEGAGRGLALIDGDRALVGTENGTLTAYALSDGKKRWSYKVSGSLGPAPILTPEHVVFVDGNNALYALDRQSGEWRWQYRRPEIPATFAVAGEAQPTLVGDQIFAGFSDGHLVALRAQDGAVLWTRDLALEHQRFKDINAKPVYAQGNLVAASVAGGLYGLNAQDGEVRWQQPTAGIMQMFEAEGDVIAATDRGEVLRISGFDGRTRWRVKFGRGEGSASGLSNAGQTVAVSLRSGGVYLLDLANGRPIQRFHPGVTLHAPPVLAQDGSLFQLTDGGVLYALRPQKASPLRGQASPDRPPLHPFEGLY